MTAFATVEDLATHLRRDLDAADTATASQALDGATQLIRSYLGQQVSETTDDIVELDSTATNLLQLPETPVTDVTEVRENGIVLDPTKYSWTASGMLWRWGGGMTWPWSTAPGIVQVTYDHGYATIPDDMRLVCLEIAARVFITTTGVEFQQFGEDSSTTGLGLGQTLSDIDRQVLDNYKLVGVG
jgi:hypothetical protein